MILRALSALWTSYAQQMANHLWQSTLFIALAAILSFALRRNQGRVRYWVWLTASLKFLLPFSLLIALGSHLAKPRATTPAQTVVYSAVEDFSQPFAEPEMPLISPAAPAPVSRLHLLPPIIVALWLAGIAVVLLVWATGWVRVSLMVHRALPLRQGPEVEALRRLESSFAVRKPIQLVLSRNWMEPGIFGVFRPVLIWPEGISQHLDARHIDAILAHEISHARRHDNFTAILHMLVEAIFWFHPLVWWMGARLEEERERACDEEVSLLCNQPHVYAESILRVCKFCSESPLACVSGITGADLKKRIVQIMTGRVVHKLDLGHKLLLLAVGLAVVAVPIMLGQAKAAQRMMLAAVASAPKPVRVWAASHALIELEQSPPTGLLAEVQGPTEIPSDAKPFAFDVVSIKPADPNDHGIHGSQFTDDGFVVESQSLEMMLMLQYPELQPYSSRIVGGGDWVRTLMWDIRAKVADSDISAWSKLSHDASASAKMRRNATIRAMLADRFKLKTHFDTRQGTVYALVVGKDGPKLKPSISDAPPRFTAHGQGHISFERTTVGSIMPFFAQELRHPAIDKTGLTGTYDITLDWMPTQGAAAASGVDAAQASDSAAPSLFTAVQEQLGLKLEAQKGPIETLVIDSAEKPSADGAEVMTPPRMVPVAQVQAVNGQGQAAQNSSSSCPDAGGLFAAYDVVSVRPTNATPRVVGLQDQPDGINSETVTVAMMVQQAYSTSMVPTDDAVTRLPDWAKMPTYFSVQAKLNPEQVTALASLSKDQQKECRVRMLQALLADRFKLQVHHETRQVLSYELVVTSGGPKMKELTASDPNVFIGSGGKPLVRGNSLRMANGGQEVVVQNFPIDQLAFVLAGTGGVDHRVVNKTGLTGIYSYTLTFAVSQGVGSAGGSSEAVASDPGPTVFQALEDQLGLKLQRGIDTVDVVVADHIERPTAN